jgi:Zn-finger nucleic acid-binding protein
MNCPSCGAPMHATGDTFQCDYCKSVYVPGKDDEGVSLLGEGPGDECPICAIALEKASIAKTPILYCGKCRGMLISMEIFPTVIETLRAQQHGDSPAPAADPKGLERHINCPHCHNPMEAHYYAGPGNVVLDSCENCELNWLDHGELLRIARAPEYEEQVMDREPDFSQ